MSCFRYMLKSINCQVRLEGKIRKIRPFHFSSKPKVWRRSTQVLTLHTPFPLYLPAQPDFQESSVGVREFWGFLQPFSLSKVIFNLKMISSQNEMGCKCSRGEKEQQIPGGISVSSWLLLPHPPYSGLRVVACSTPANLFSNLAAKRHSF